MRESIGGAWLTGLVVTFIALFAAFLVYAVNYTKAFRVKDRIITIIEEKEGFTLSQNSNGIKNLSIDQLNEDGSAEAAIYGFINQIGYNYADNISCNGNVDNDYVNLGSDYGYCLEKHCVLADNANRVYYKVTTYISLNIPIINYPVKIPISGETASLFFDSTGTDANCFGVNEEVSE